MNIYQKLAAVQGEIEVPKGQFNSFGKYNYRSCEDILAVAKPLCIKHGLVLTVSDDVEEIGGRVYVKATASVVDVDVSAQEFDITNIVVNTAYSREELEKKGMDASQITGTASSYARKYALNGLFAIDDTKDADTDEHSNVTNRQTKTERKAETKTDDVPVRVLCEDCGETIVEAKGYKADIIIEESKKRYGKVICYACMQRKESEKRKSAIEAARKA